MVRLLFPDGSTVEADDYHGLLVALLDGWNPPHVEALKRTLAKRCVVLVGRGPDPSLADDDFVRALDALGFWTLQSG